MHITKNNVVSIVPVMPGTQSVVIYFRDRLKDPSNPDKVHEVQRAVVAMAVVVYDPDDAGAIGEMVQTSIEPVYIDQDNGMYTWPSEGTGVDSWEIKTGDRV